MFAQSRQGLALNKKFKVDEDSSQVINSRLFKVLVGGFLSTCNNGYSYQSKTSNSSKWNSLTNC